MAAERGKGVKPFGHTAIAKYLDEKIEDMKAFKTQRQIAEEVGFKIPNMISMLKNGDSKVPLDKIVLLARALDADAGHLLRLGLEQYWEGFGDVIAQIFGHIASTNELELFLNKWRQVTGDMDPKPTPSMRYTAHQMIIQVAGSWERTDERNS